MQITIQRIWSNDQNKPNGKFVGTDGKTYFIEARFHGLLREGMMLDPPSVKPSEFQGKTNYFLPKGWGPPPDNTVGAIIPQPNGNAQPAANGFVRPTAPPYVPKDEDLITRLAILKSLIESGALLQGMGMDDLIALAWETAPKLKVWSK